MKTGIMRVKILTDGSRSLKEKRMLVRSVKDKLKSRFNISIAEVDDQDLWQRATFGIAVVGADGTYVESVLNKVAEFFRNHPKAVLLDIETEVY